MKLRNGDVVTVYEDWQKACNLIGVACLVKKKRNGLPFILEDTVTVKSPEKTIIYNDPIYNWKDVEVPLEKYKVYNYERWDCLLIKSSNPRYKEGETYSLNIRYLEGEYSDSSLPEENDFRSKEGVIIDSFIKINDMDIY